MKKIVAAVAVLVVIGSAALFGGRAWDGRARAALLEAEILKGLSAEEIALIMKSEAIADRESIAAMKENADKRQTFLNGMREYLALAAEARRTGLANDENFKINVAYKKDILLADLYRAKLSLGEGKLFIVPEGEIKTLWTKPENETQFNRDMRAMREIQRAALALNGNQTPVSELRGEALAKARENWARTRILSDRAKSDAGFMAQPEIGLRLKIVEAGILANDFMRENWMRRVKATDAEISDYLGAHPEYDVSRKRQTAEAILQRVKNGEDFAKLAKELSEDRGSKESGGLYADVNQNVLWREVEEAAARLEKGQIAEQIVESSAGYHVVKLEKREKIKNAAGSESFKFSVRHILLQKSFEEPGAKNADIPPPFMKAEEIARVEIEKEKRERFVAEILERNPVSLPADFSVELPEISGK